MLPRLIAMLLLPWAGCAELEPEPDERRELGEPREYEEPAAPLDGARLEALLASPLPLEDEEEVRALPGAVSTSSCEPAHAVPECRVHEVSGEGLRARIVTVPDKAPMVASLELARPDVRLAGGLRVGQSQGEVAARLGARSLDEVEGESVVVSRSDGTLRVEDELGAPSALMLRFDEGGTLVRVEYQGYVD